MLWPLILSGLLDCSQTSVYGLFFSLLLGLLFPDYQHLKKMSLAHLTTRGQVSCLMSQIGPNRTWLSGLEGWNLNWDTKNYSYCHPNFFQLYPFFYNFIHTNQQNKGKPKPKPVPLISWFHEVWNTPITEVNRHRCLEETAQASGIRFELTSVLTSFSLAHVSQGAVQSPPLSLQGPWVPVPDVET